MNRTSGLLVDYYQAYLKDQDTAAFVARIAARYLPATLERVLATGPPERRRAAALALGFLGDFSAVHPLGRVLTDVDRVTRQLAEDSIRKCWRRQGTEAERRAVETLCERNTAQRYSEALELSAELVARAPGLAEAWNQRAIAYFNLGRYPEAIHDCHQALELNAYHFDAAAGMAQCFLQLGDAEAALDCLRRALRINPGLEGVRAGVQYLERRQQ